MLLARGPRVSLKNLSRACGRRCVHRFYLVILFLFCFYLSGPIQELRGCIARKIGLEKGVAIQGGRAESLSQAHISVMVELYQIILTR